MSICTPVLLTIIFFRVDKNIFQPPRSIQTLLYLVNQVITFYYNNIKQLQ